MQLFWLLLIDDDDDDDDILSCLVTLLSICNVQYYEA